MAVDKPCHRAPGWRALVLLKSRTAASKHWPWPAMSNAMALYVPKTCGTHRGIFASQTLAATYQIAEDCHGAAGGSGFPHLCPAVRVARSIDWADLVQESMIRPCSASLRDKVGEEQCVARLNVVRVCSKAGTTRITARIQLHVEERS